MSARDKVLGDPVAKSGSISSGSDYNAINSSTSVSRGGGGNVQRARWKPSVFDFKSERGGSQCPTCKGLGRIPKGQEEELVALIPYNDKRLKPRRTCLYVFLMALLLIVTGGVVTAFLYPRSVMIKVSAINDTTLPNITEWIGRDNSSFDVLLGVKTTLSVKNSNFFPVTVSVVNVTLMYYEVEVGFLSYPTFSVKSRSSKNVSVIMKARFVQAQSRKIRVICTPSGGWAPEIYLTASALAQYSYLSQTSSSVGEQGGYVACSNATSVMSAPTFMPPFDESIT